MDSIVEIIKKSQIKERKVKYGKHCINNIMTLVIGIRCSDGVVLIGDRKVVRGTECSEEKKMFSIGPDFVIGYSGVTSLMDKFMFSINGYLANPDTSKLWVDFAGFLEDSVTELRNRYIQRMDNVSFDVLYCGKMTPDHANLYHIYNGGFSEEIKTFDAIGHGQPYAIPFLKAAYSPEITIDKATRLGVFVLQLVDSCNVDILVGGKPQIFKIPDNGSAEEIPEHDIDRLLRQMTVREKLKVAIFK